MSVRLKFAISDLSSIEFSPDPLCRFCHRQLGDGEQREEEHHRRGQGTHPSREGGTDFREFGAGRFPEFGVLGGGGGGGGKFKPERGGGARVEERPPGRERDSEEDGDGGVDDVEGRVGKPTQVSRLKSERLTPFTIESTDLS